MISLAQALKERILLLNAAPSNPAWSKLPDSAWGGSRPEWPPNLNLTRPDLILEWNIELLKAGADVLETRSIGADRFTATQEYGADRALCGEWNRASVAIVRQAAAGQGWITGAMSFQFDLLTLLRGHSFEEHVEATAEQVRDLWSAGVDAIHLAYVSDSQNLKAAFRGIAAAEDDLGCRIPTMISFDLDQGGTILSGERPEDLWQTLRDHEPIALGLATYGYGQDNLRRLRDVTDVPIGLLLDPYPWAHPLTENRPVEWLTECLTPLLDERLLNFCGLSCTVPSIEHVKAIAALIR